MNSEHPNTLITKINLVWKWNFATEYKEIFSIFIIFYWDLLG